MHTVKSLWVVRDLIDELSAAMSWVTPFPGIDREVFPVHDIANEVR